jgi:GntR family transcriptional regulator/MocR family aminotransferase
VPAALARDVSAAKLSADRGSPALEQRALAAFIEAGDLDRHLRRSRALYRRRRDALVAAFAALAPGMWLRGSAAGLHVLLELPAGADEAAIVEGARRRDIRLFGTRAYHLTDRSPAPGLLLGYGAVPEEEILGGVRALLPLITATGAARDAKVTEPSGRIRRVPSVRAR